MKNLLLYALIAGALIAPAGAVASRIVIGADTKVFETPIAIDECAAVNDNDEISIP